MILRKLKKKILLITNFKNVNKLRKNDTPVFAGWLDSKEALSENGKSSHC